MISKWFLAGGIGIAQKMVILTYSSPSTHGLSSPGHDISLLSVKTDRGWMLEAFGFPSLKNYFYATIIPLAFLLYEYLLSLNVPSTKGFKVESFLYNN